MAYLNIISYIILSVIAVIAVQINSVPVECNWIDDATNSIKESLTKVESFRVHKNYEKIKMIADESFDSFTSFVEKDLSEIIEQVDGRKSEEAFELESKLLKWLEDLRILKYGESDIIEKKNDKALGKFLLTMDYVSNEVMGFYDNYNPKSSESEQILEKLKSLTQRTVTKLVEYAKSVEDQVSGIVDDTTDYIV